MAIKSAMTRTSLKKIEKITNGPLTLGRLLWSIRQTHDESSQVVFAKKLGISRQQLCNIEHDRKVVSPQLANHYAKKLDYSSEQFVRLALQGMVDKAGLNFLVRVVPKRGRGK
ncbi:MAG: XRE family transcriptional regulator [Pseudomonadota bacterium]